MEILREAVEIPPQLWRGWEAGVGSSFILCQCTVSERKECPTPFLMAGKAEDRLSKKYPNKKICLIKIYKQEVHLKRSSTLVKWSWYRYFPVWIMGLENLPGVSPELRLGEAGRGLRGAGMGAVWVRSSLWWAEARPGNLNTRWSHRWLRKNRWTIRSETAAMQWVDLPLLC